MLYICTKFREIISKRYQSYGPDTNVQPLSDGRTDGRTDTQKFGGYNIIPRHFLWRGIKTIIFVFKVPKNEKKNNNEFHFSEVYRNVNVVVALLFYVHGKHLRSCRDGQLS